ncbi:MAG: site-specific integrase [Caldimonas sp.]
MKTYAVSYAVTGGDRRVSDQVRPDQEELERHGLEPDVKTESNQDISVLVRFEEGQAQPWSMSGLAKGIKALLTDIATDLEPEDAKQLRKASTHWLRHSHGSHALNGRPGEAGVPIQVVQNNLGHASIGTTSGYLTTERDMRLAAMKGFGDGASRAGRKT